MPPLPFKTITRPTTFLMAAIALLTMLALGKNAASPNFWLDEAGQFWLAMGQYHMSAANTPTGSLWSMWEFSKGFNADPGGFTLLLRTWVRLLGSTPIALRLLPLAFGVLFLCLTYVWSRQLSLLRPIGIAAALLFLMSPSVAYYFFELRAYSMELCGVVALWIATSVLLAAPTWPALLVWILVDWFFLTSRYSFVIYSLATCTILFWRALTNRQSRALLLSAVATAIGMMGILYFGMLRFQSVNASPPVYVQSILLAGHPERIPHTILHNLFSPAAIASTLLVLIVIVAAARYGRNRVPDFSDQLRPFYWLTGYIALADLGWLLLSLLGKMPWDVSSRWCLSEYGMTALAIPALVSFSWQWMKRQWPEPPTAILTAGVSLLCAASIVVGVNSFRIVANHFDRDLSVSEHLLSAMASLDCSERPVTVILDEGFWPDYRYLVERSGLPIPCAGRMTVYRVKLAQPDSYDQAHLLQKRPVTFILGSWDQNDRERLVRHLQALGSVQSESFGPFGFTSVVTLR